MKNSSNAEKIICGSLFKERGQGRVCKVKRQLTFLRLKKKKLSLVIQVPDARDRAAVVAALLQLLLQALQSSILDHGGLHRYHGFSLVVDLCPENTLQVILKKTSQSDTVLFKGKDN